MLWASLFCSCTYYHRLTTTTTTIVHTKKTTNQRSPQHATETLKAAIVTVQYHQVRW